jgi:hypothetical protein
MKNASNVTLFVLCVFLLMNFVKTNNQSCEISHQVIENYTKNLQHRAPSKKPLQITCCRSGDPNNPSAFGARCVSGQQNCTENACPEGTSECGDKD